MSDLIRISNGDDVAVSLYDLKKGENYSYDNEIIKTVDDIPFGHKVALHDIKEGSNIIKYGYPIGHATKDIKIGEHIHTHNLKTNLSGTLEYAWCGHDNEIVCNNTDIPTFMGYKRNNGKVL